MKFFMKHFCDILAIVLALFGIFFVIGYNQYWLLISVAIGYALSFIPVIIARKKRQ